MSNMFLKGIKRGFSSFGHNISIIINTFLLFIVYTLGIGITSLFAKISKKHFLEIKTDKNAKTYWADLNLKKKSLEEYYRQF